VKLSRKETKYRIKFIQECHYNKLEQRQFDKAKNDLNKSYKQIYNDMIKGITYLFMATISAQRMVNVITKTKVTVAQAAQALAMFGNEIMTVDVELEKTEQSK